MQYLLVTGGAGFIGSYTVRLLIETGYRVIVVDNLYSGSLDRLRGLPRSGIVFLEADVSDIAGLRERLTRLVSRGDLAGVIHLAAIVGVVEASREPSRALSVNVGGTLSILELARLLDVERIVYASSAAVYGEPRYIPVDEEHPLEPLNLYGETKAMGERLLWLYQRLYSLKPIALRYFNVYGPGMRPGPYAGVIHRFITSLLEGEPPLIHGDGEQTRDFVYVGDVAEANLKALESRYTGPVNIGTGVETSINKLYSLVCSIIPLQTGCPEPRYAPPRPGDIRRSRASVKRAREALGWEPRTSLEQGLRSTVKYYLARSSAEAS